MSAHPSPAAALCAVALVLLLAAADAAALAPAAAQEIDALLTRLAASGCQFKRNGSWHDGAAARTHLQRKLDYLKKHDAVASAEQFIERAATRSSVSGEAYWVRCGSAPPQPSAVWLGAQLKALRAAAPPR
jgi:hypothetical protein